MLKWQPAAMLRTQKEGAAFGSLHASLTTSAHRHKIEKKSKVGVMIKYDTSGICFESIQKLMGQRYASHIPSRITELLTRAPRLLLLPPCTLQPSLIVST